MSRGYTVVEVLIALTILTIGTSGVIAMQKVTAISNREARNLAIANQIARGWLDRLRVDAETWNHPSLGNPVSDLGDTRWLQNVTGDWFRPADDDRGSAAADALGNDVRDKAGDFATAAVFCTNLRLSWLYGSANATRGPLVLRAEVRVFWLRQGAGGSVEAGKHFCDPAMDLAAATQAVDRYHFVYLTSGISQNTAR